MCIHAGRLLDGLDPHVCVLSACEAQVHRQSAVAHPEAELAALLHVGRGLGAVVRVLCPLGRGRLRVCGCEQERVHHLVLVPPEHLAEPERIVAQKGVVVHGASDSGKAAVVPAHLDIPVGRRVRLALSRFARDLVQRPFIQ